MNVFLILAHPERRSFNGAMFDTAAETLRGAGHAVATSDLYGGGRIYETGTFRGRRAMLSLTTGGPQAAYQPGGFNGDLEAILRPIHRGMLAFEGFSVLAPQVTYGPARADDAQRQEWLAAWAQRLRAIEGEQPVDVGTY